jgi:hypothetical protein
VKRDGKPAPGRCQRGNPRSLRRIDHGCCVVLGEHSFDRDHIGGVLGEPLLKTSFHLEKPMCHVQVRAGAHYSDRDEHRGAPHRAVHHTDTTAGETRIDPQNALFLEHQFGL